MHLNLDPTSVWQLYIPGGVILALFAILARWINRLQRKLEEPGERVAHLEGRLDQT